MRKNEARASFKYKKGLRFATKFWKLKNKSHCYF